MEKISSKKNRQTDGALCTDCHGSPHYITKAKDGNSPMSRKYQVETCLKCHADKDIIQKYNLEANVMESFKESFHGRKLHLGHTKAPTCASCHNAHDIKTRSDPTSPVFGQNKLETYGKCHSGMTAFKKDITYPSKTLSAVTFSHELHTAMFTCDDCHAKTFKYRKGGSGMKMDDLYQGKYCATCHNGQAAFGSNDCQLCHKQ